jgi:hypothetical protein
MRYWCGGGAMRGLILAAVALTHGSATRAELRVMNTQDVVHFASGEELRGTVLAAGLKAVVLVVETDTGVAERIIPREQVRSITRGGISPTVTIYTAEPVEGVSVVTGIGTAWPSEEGAEGEGGAGAGRKAPGGAGEGSGGAREDGRRGGGARGTGVTEQQLRELMKKNPGLRRIIDSLGGPDKARRWLEQNRSRPEIRKYIEQFTKGGKLPFNLPIRLPTK